MLKKKLIVALAEVVLGTLLVGGSLLPQGTITAQEMQDSSWRPTPAPVKHQKAPAAPLFITIGIGFIGKGMYDLWTLEDPNSDEPEYNVESYQPVPVNVAPPSVTRPYRVQTPARVEEFQETVGVIASCPIASPPRSIPQGNYKPQQTVIDKLELTNFLYIAARNRQSLVMAGPPGIGKTTTLLAWLYSVFEADSSTQFFIASRKRDRWLGLGLLPEVFQQIGKRDEDYRKLFRHVERVSRILYERMDLEEEERGESNPVWLVLDDWFSITNSLNKSSGDIKKEWEACLANIGDIITLGREQKVGVCVSTHSLNLAALGVAEDANIRACLSILALGRIVVDEHGRKEGGYDAINLAMRNPYILDDDYRAPLTTKLPELKKASRECGQPVIFSTMGEPTVGLLPNLCWAKEVEIPVDSSAIAERLNALHSQDFGEPEIEVQVEAITEDVWATTDD